MSGNGGGTKRQSGKSGQGQGKGKPQAGKKRSSGRRSDQRTVCAAPPPACPQPLGGQCFGVVTECKSGFLRTKCVHGEVFHIKREQSGARAKGSRQLVKGTRISFTLAHTAHNGHFRPARKARRMIDDGQGGIISERGPPAAATPPFAALTEAGSVLRAALDDIMGRAAAMDDYVPRRETELRQMEVEAANEVRRTRKAAETWAADFKRRAEEEVASLREIAESERSALVASGSAEAAAMQAAASADAKNIENERAVWEAEKQSIAEIQKFDSDVVTINVGGQVFSTYLSTITTGAAADSMLAVLFSGRHSVATDSEGRMFLDQDPVLFADLLTFFRSPLSFSLPDDRRTAIRLLFLAPEYQVTALFDRFAWSETKSARLASQQLTRGFCQSGFQVVGQGSSFVAKTSTSWSAGDGFIIDAKSVSLSFRGNGYDYYQSPSKMKVVATMKINDKQVSSGEASGCLDGSEIQIRFMPSTPTMVSHGDTLSLRFVLTVKKAASAAAGSSSHQHYIGYGRQQSIISGSLSSFQCNLQELFDPSLAPIIDSMDK